MAMSQGPTLAIDLGRRQLRAVSIARTNGNMAVSAVIRGTVPEQIDVDDAEALGHWLRVELDRAGISTRSAVFAISRDHVVLKQVTLPTTDPDELPGMVRYSIEQDLPIDAEEPAAAH